MGLKGGVKTERDPVARDGEEKPKPFYLYPHGALIVIRP